MYSPFNYYKLNSKFYFFPIEERYVGFNFSDKHQASDFFEIVDTVEEKLKTEMFSRKSRGNLFEKNSKNRMSVKKYSADSPLDTYKVRPYLSSCILRLQFRCFAYSLLFILLNFNSFIQSPNHL